MSKIIKNNLKSFENFWFGGSSKKVSGGLGLICASTKSSKPRFIAFIKLPKIIVVEKQNFCSYVYIIYLLPGIVKIKNNATKNTLVRSQNLRIEICVKLDWKLRLQSFRVPHQAEISWWYHVVISSFSDLTNLPFKDLNCYYGGKVLPAAITSNLTWMIKIEGVPP